jgi:hypothetical protein
MSTNIATINRVAAACVTPVPWSIKTSPCDGYQYIVFHNKYDVCKWVWLFSYMLKLPLVCYGDYENAYGPIKE